MGNCINCFKQQANDAPSSKTFKKDEMTEIISCQQIPLEISAAYPQQEPLLSNNENHIHFHTKIDTYPQNDQHFKMQGDCSIDDIATQKIQLNPEKKPFYQKLQSIPINMPTLGCSELKVSESKINQLFDLYKDSLEDAILAEGIEHLCNDLQLSLDDFKVLLLAWKLNASQMCKFTKTEFVEGLMKNMKTDSIKGIQTKLNEIANQLKNDPEQFKDLYRFTFKFGLDISTGQRILPSDIAILLWRLVFTNNEPAILDRWLAYLENNSHIRGIPKDTWYMFLNFCEYIGNDLSSYDDTEAWPSLFDDFVEYENDQANQNITKNGIKGQD